ncbi:MAG: MmcQ/YjbR family DNA-binding protein [Kofleriaceae bacterium]
MSKPTRRTTKPKQQAAPARISSRLAMSQLAKIRAFCLALPDVTEKASHGFPTFFTKQKVFVYFLDNHHDDGRLALWCLAPQGAQAMLVDANPDHYFVPPYVGYQGWIGVRLDREAAWSEVTAIIEQAYETRRAK